ncbi:MAG: GatB/YqeY domain-containing protein [Streptosporangiales bacterium]|nr:GatB/YqeY domain-containing protein [Streptosporangiales bacterium]MBO0889589.1 GatB/YqeY domain-containing protein [Acidothermales bacterium]
MASLKERLQTDLHDAMKARDDVRRRTIRMVLTAVSTEEVSGDAARELSDDEVLDVLATQAKRRRESAEVFAGNGRDDLAEKEREELGVLESYLPAQLGDDELRGLVDAAVAETGASSPKQLGLVVKTVLGKVGKQADGKRVAALVRERLTSG